MRKAPPQPATASLARRIGLASLRSRLLFSLLVVFVLAEAVIGLTSYRTVLRESQGLFDYHLEQMALSLRDQGAVITPQLPFDERQRFDFVVQIWSADGSKIYLSQTRSKARLPDRATLGFVDIDADGERWRAYSIVARGRIIQVAQPYEVRQRIAASAALRSLMPLMLLAPIVAIAIWWLVGRSLAPLERMARELRQRDASRLDPVPDADLPTEIEPMARSLNALFARLSRAFEAQRAFIADAAHELRTPLTALKLQAGLLARARTEAQRQDALTQLRAGIDRSAHLIDQLLGLARSEAGDQGGPAPADDEPLSANRGDLVSIATEAIGELQALAAERNGRISLQAPASLLLQAAPGALRSLVHNLVENSIRHGRARDGIIVVSVVDSPGGAALIVDDDGPGIPETERERVFDRFYGRTAGSDTGSGLGLAISRAIVQRLGGSIKLTASPQSGLRAEVRFPPGLSLT